MSIEKPRFGSIVEAKFELEQLRLKRKELQLRKQDVAAQQQSLRANHTQALRHMPPAVQGRGFLSRIIRAYQRGARHLRRSDLASDHAPLATQSSSLSAYIRQIDARILELQQFLRVTRAAGVKLDRNATVIGNPVETGRPKILG